MNSAVNKSEQSALEEREGAHSPKAIATPTAVHARSPVANRKYKRERIRPCARMSALTLTELQPVLMRVTQ